MLQGAEAGEGSSQGRRRAAGVAAAQGRGMGHDGPTLHGADDGVIAEASSLHIRVFLRPGPSPVRVVVVEPELRYEST